jgi:iron complex outermembrane receptor protein
MDKATLPSLIASSTALSLAMASAAHGQAGALEEITVTAMRIETSLARVPAAVSVIGQDDIQLARQQLALDESLSRVPGLFMQNRYNFAQDLRVSIRGFGARANFGIRGVKILVDGIPETLPDGQGSVDGIDIGSTSQIEVLRGPSSTLYGNASGGVIAVTSERAPEEAFADVRLSAGDYGFRKLQIKTGGQTERVGYLLSLSDSELDGYRQQSRAENTQLSGRFDFDLGQDREFLAVVNFTDQPTSDDPGGITAAQAAADPRSARDLNVLYDGGELLEQSRVGFVYSMPVGADAEISARNYYVWRDFGANLPFTGGGVVALDRFFAGGGVSYSRSGSLGDRPNQFVVGFDFDSQDDDRMRFDNNLGVQGALTFDQNESVNSQGLFIQNQVSLSDKMDLSFGVRFDEVEFDVSDRFLSDGDDSGKRKLDDTSPMLGLSVALSDNLVFYSTYSSAFETPTTTEFNNPDGSGGFNPTLNPQTARNLEVGLRGSPNSRHRYEIALFNIEVDDELIPFEVPGSPGRDFFANAGKSQRDGLEFSLVSEPTDRIRTTLSYTYSDFKFEEFTDGGTNFAGNQIPGTPENVIFGEISYRDPRGWFGAFDFIMIDDQFANNANSAISDSYTLSNLRFGFEKELSGMTVSPFLGINNLFDEVYNSNLRINAFGGRFFEPAPDRNAYAGVSLGFNFR